METNLVNNVALKLSERFPQTEFLDTLEILNHHSWRDVREHRYLSG